MSAAISGIPTLYDGVLFRSRLEAKWAAFFDRLRWPWSYEPFDLYGYIPDFILRFPHAEMLVEVKPDMTLEALRKHSGKIAQSGWSKEYLIVGACLLGEGCYGERLGVLAEITDDDLRVLETANAFHCINCGAISLHAEDGNWRCRVNGCGETTFFAGNAHVAVADHLSVKEQWNEAGNRVQWMPEARRP